MRLRDYHRNRGYNQRLWTVGTLCDLRANELRFNGTDTAWTGPATMKGWPTHLPDLYEPAVGGEL